MDGEPEEKMAGHRVFDRQFNFDLFILSDSRLEVKASRFGHSD